MEIIRGSAVGFIVKALGAMGIFLMNIAIARSLGSTESGVFFLAFTIITFLSAFSRMGLDNTVVRFIAACSENNEIRSLHHVLLTAFIWAISMSVVVAITLFMSADFISEHILRQPGLGAVLKKITLSIPLITGYFLLSMALQGLKKIALSMVILNVIVPICVFISLHFICVQTALDTSLLYIGSCFIAFCFGVFCWYRISPQITEDQSVINKRIIWSSSFPLWGATVLNQISLCFSQLMLGYWSSSDAVAFFATAQRTAMLISFILVAVNAIAAPKFSALHTTGDSAALKDVAMGSVRLMMLAAFPVLVIMLLFPEYLMGLFGPGFKVGAFALQILAVGQFINVATGSVGVLLMMTGHERLLRFNVFIGAVWGMVIGFILIPRYGLIGAAIATTTAIASQNLLGVIQVKRVLGFNNMAFWKVLPNEDLVR